jgi:hypothetical protein
MEDLLSVLLHSVNQVHIFHLQTKSFAEHKALGSYYDSIGDIADELAEAYQGKYGILKYKNVSKIEQYESKEQVIEYFGKIIKVIEKARPIKDPFIDNIVQEIEKLIYQTLYKLKYLN